MSDRIKNDYVNVFPGLSPLLQVLLSIIIVVIKKKKIIHLFIISTFDVRRRCIVVQRHLCFKRKTEDNSATIRVLKIY